MADEPETQPVVLDIAPGLFTEDTEVGAVGRWKDGERIRFWKGYAEKLGGWVTQTLTGATIRGVVRAVQEWETLDRQTLLAIGTSSKLYIISRSVVYDITPLRREVARTDPFATTNGSGIVTVTDAAHEAVAGDWVKFEGATVVGGLLIDGEYQIVSTPTPDTYTINFGSNAGSTTTGGGTVTMRYDIGSGLDSDGFYFGFGTCTFNNSTWGTPRGACSTMARPVRIWSLDSWGEDLVASPTGESVYYWDYTLGLSSRAVLIPEAPVSNQRILVSPDSRQLICLGANTGTGPDPLLIRVSDNENFRQFTASTGNRVYTRRVQGGSRIITGKRTRSGILVWTDRSVHILQPVDSSAVYVLRPLAEGNSIIGPNAGIEVDGVVFYMGFRKFLRYDGVLTEIPCDVWQRIWGPDAGGFNFAQQDKVYCWLNDAFSEIWWQYPSAGSSECDRYVVYNYVENHWSYGTLARTAGQQKTLSYGGPIAFGANGALYRHEVGVDDAGAAMTTFLESYDVQIADGDEVLHVSKCIPDFKRRTGVVDLYLKTKRYAEDAAYTTKGPYALTSGRSSVRAAGKQMAIRIETSAVGADYRLGKLRFEGQPDGER